MSQKKIKIYRSVSFTSTPSAVNLRIFGNEINPKFPKISENFEKIIRIIFCNQLSNLPSTYQPFRFLSDILPSAVNIPPRFFLLTQF